MTARPRIELPIVDTHAHVYRAGMPVSPGAWIAPGEARTVEDYVAALDEHGVPFGVIAAMSAFGDYNDYTLDALRRHKRLRGTGIANPQTSLAELRAWRTAGLTGIRFMLLRADLPDFQDFGWRKLLTRLCDLDMHVHVLIEPERLAYFLAALADYSALRIVIDHFGFPDIRRGLECTGFQTVLHALESGNVWVKMSAFHRMADTGSLFSAALLKNAGTERLMWGTDWPFLAAPGPCTFDEAIAAFEHCVPDPAQRRAISETALRFYFFD